MRGIGVQHKILVKSLKYVFWLTIYGKKMLTLL
jgi:hypothetical protein